MNFFCCVAYVTLLWGLHIVIKGQFFYIYWHVTLELTICEIFAVKWQKSVSERPIMVNRNPFLDPWTEVIATKRGETTSGTSLTSCKISRQSVTHLRRDICPRTKNTGNRRYQAGNTNKHHHHHHQYSFIIMLSDATPHITIITDKRMDSVDAYGALAVASGALIFYCQTQESLAPGFIIVIKWILLKCHK